MDQVRRAVLPRFHREPLDLQEPPADEGAIIKHYFAQREGIDPSKIFSVSIMPCTAKKFECGRPEMINEGTPDVDAVLTTRELARFIRQRGIDMSALSPDTADTPFGQRSTAGKIVGTSGGVMEAALRTAYWLITGKDMEDPKIQDVRGHKGIKETRITIDGLELGFAVASGLGNARKLLEEIRAGRKDIHFIEIMTCPGGCIAGGGQPLGANQQAIRQRMQKLYTIDRDEKVQFSHKNEEIIRITKISLKNPLARRAITPPYALRKARRGGTVTVVSRSRTGGAGHVPPPVRTYCGLNAGTRLYCIFTHRRTTMTGAVEWTFR